MNGMIMCSGLELNMLSIERRWMSMRKVMLLTMMVMILMPEFCFAMHFYKSEKLGTFYFNQANHGFMLEGETSNIVDKDTKE